MKKIVSKRSIFASGIKAGIPVCLGYFAVAFALGIAAKNAGITPLQGLFMSLLNNASAGEYAAVTVIKDGGAYIEMALVTLVANARYLLMSCALSQRFSPDTGLIHRLIMGFDLTDEIFGITLSQEGDVVPCYTYGAMVISMIGWASGTVLGITAGSLLPEVVVNALSVALYGMFLAIIIPPAKKDKVVAMLVAISFASSFALAKLPVVRELSETFRIIILTVVISAFAAAIFPKKENENEG